MSVGVRPVVRGGKTGAAGQALLSSAHWSPDRVHCDQNAAAVACSHTARHSSKCNDPTHCADLSHHKYSIFSNYFSAITEGIILMTRWSLTLNGWNITHLDDVELVMKPALKLHWQKHLKSCKWCYFVPVQLQAGECGRTMLETEVKLSVSGQVTRHDGCSFRPWCSPAELQRSSSKILTLSGRPSRKDSAYWNHIMSYVCQC